MKAIISKNEIVSTVERQHMWRKETGRGHVLYFGCHTGLGKTCQAEFFAEEHYQYRMTLSAEKEGIYQRFQEWMEQIPDIRARKMLIIDEVTYVMDGNENIEGIKKIIGERTDKNPCDLIIIGRTACPDWLMPYRLSGTLTCYGREIFLLSDDEIVELMKYKLKDIAVNLAETGDNWIREKTEEIIKSVRGYGLAASYYAELVKENGNMDVSYEQKMYQLLWKHVDSTAAPYFDEKSRQCLEKLAVFKAFTVDMAEDVLNEEELAVFRHILKFCSYITLDGKNIYRIDEMFKGYAENRLRQRNEGEYLKIQEMAGKSCEKRRMYKEALELYHKCGNRELLAHLIIAMTERSDGTDFPRECRDYLSDFTDKDFRNNAALLCARIMIESYALHLEESNRLLEILRKMAMDERKRDVYGEARKNYIKAVFCLPHQTQADCQDVVVKYMELITNDDSYEGKLQVTGGGPSVINGGVDQMGWAFQDQDVYDYMKNVMGYIIGPDGTGLADVGTGEYYLEINNRMKAVNYIITGISALRSKENFRGYYAGNAIMARAFLEENRMEPAKDIMQNLLKQVKGSYYPELAPNVMATYIELLLYEGTGKEVLAWIDNEREKGIGNPIYREFFASERYQLYVLAKAYVATEKYMGAAVIMWQLFSYAEMFERKYYKIKLYLMGSVIRESTGEDGRGEIIEAVLLAAQDRYIRVIADEGAAIRETWEKIDWNRVMEERKEELPDNFEHYLKTVEKEMKTMARYYPEYMRKKPEDIELSKSEKLVMELLYQGKTNEKIAEALNITLSTVKFHVSNILKKMQVKSRQEAVKKAMEMGWYS